MKTRLQLQVTVSVCICDGISHVWLSDKKMHMGRQKKTLTRNRRWAASACCMAPRGACWDTMLTDRAEVRCPRDVMCCHHVINRSNESTQWTHNYQSAQLWSSVSFPLTAFVWTLRHGHLPTVENAINLARTRNYTVFMWTYRALVSQCLCRTKRWREDLNGIEEGSMIWRPPSCSVRNNAMKTFKIALHSLNHMLFIKPHCLQSAHQACCYRRSSAVCLCVCLLVTFVSPAKTIKPIKMPFGWVTRVGAKNHVLDGIVIPHAKERF